MRDPVCIPLLLVIGVCIFPGLTWAHALSGKQVQGAAALVIQFAYSTGDAPAYAAVEVYSPDDTRVEYQNGRTDKAGRFAFSPDKSGEWRVRIKDTMGHLAEIPINVTLPAAVTFQDKLTSYSDDPASAQTFSKGWRALLGVSLIMNFFVSLTWFRTRYLLGKKAASCICREKE